MTWESPHFIEINMSSEIGGYQDSEERRGSEPLASFVTTPATPVNNDGTTPVFK